MDIVVPLPPLVLLPDRSHAHEKYKIGARSSSFLSLSLRLLLCINNNWGVETVLIPGLIPSAIVPPWSAWVLVPFPFSTLSFLLLSCCQRSYCLRVP